MKTIEVLITASIPDGDDELGHDAIVAVRTPAQAIVDALSELGLSDIRKKSTLKVKRPRGEGEPVEAAPVRVSVSNE
jgi:hypothetical protein